VVGPGRAGPQDEAAELPDEELLDVLELLDEDALLDEVEAPDDVDAAGALDDLPPERESVR
jgi:hypothetical protein